MYEQLIHSSHHSFLLYMSDSVYHLYHLIPWCMYLTICVRERLYMYQHSYYHILYMYELYNPFLYMWDQLLLLRSRDRELNLHLLLYL